MLKKLLLSGLALSTALVLVACGSDSKSSKSDSGTTESSVVASRAESNKAETAGEDKASSEATAEGEGQIAPEAESVYLVTNEDGTSSNLSIIGDKGVLKTYSAEGQETSSTEFTINAENNTADFGEVAGSYSKDEGGNIKLEVNGQAYDFSADSATSLYDIR